MSLAEKILAAVLYAAVTLLANPVLAGGADAQTLSMLRTGEMKKLVVHETPAAVSAEPFLTEDGNPVTLADYSGKVVLVNFWATWCAPCRAEMASLNRLQQTLGGDKFEVLTIATGRNPLPAIHKFFAEEEITDLPILRDPKRALSRDMGVLGLPTSVILNAEGQEVARMVGDADWASEDALAFLRAVIAMGQAGG